MKKENRFSPKRTFRRSFDCTFVCDLPIHVHSALLIYRVACSILAFEEGHFEGGLSDFVETLARPNEKKKKHRTQSLYWGVAFFLYLSIYFIIILYNFFSYSFFSGGHIHYCYFYFSLVPSRLPSLSGPNIIPYRYLMIFLSSRLLVAPPRTMRRRRWSNNERLTEDVLFFSFSAIFPSSFV